MKDRDEYLQEVKNRLGRMFRASKDGHKASPMERHRLEGFIQAGSSLGLATSDEMEALMDQVHFDILEKTIDERKSKQSSLWSAETIDYSQYENPSYERNRP